MDYLQISDGQYTKTIYTMVRKLLFRVPTIKRVAGSRRQRSHEIVMFGDHFRGPMSSMGRPSAMMTT